MKLPLNALSVVVTVTATALFGMFIGGIFGYCAALLAPDFFRTPDGIRKFEPQGIAIVLGSFGGILCGGGLGVFAIVIHAFSASMERVGSKKSAEA